jgi:hypothetical protein
VATSDEEKDGGYAHQFGTFVGIYSFWNLRFAPLSNDLSLESDLLYLDPSEGIDVQFKRMFRVSVLVSMLCNTRLQDPERAVLT